MTIEQVDTVFRNGEYHLTLTATLAAPLPRVEEVIRDYARYAELDERIREARVIAQPSPDVVELFTRIEVCVSFLCRQVSRFETVQMKPGELIATIQPARSDTERGETRTLLTAQGAQTRLEYSTYIVPKFWVPGWFARPALLRTLHDATLALFTRVERRAQSAE